jgi:predicted AAA+ superfamily ATPase
MISSVIAREQYLGRVRKALGRNSVVAFLEPRQCGKITLARQLMPDGHPQ